MTKAELFRRLEQYPDDAEMMLSNSTPAEWSGDTADAVPLHGEFQGGTNKETGNPQIILFRSGDVPALTHTAGSTGY
jgi:hypothetical protein